VVYNARLPDMCDLRNPGWWAYGRTYRQLPIEEIIALSEKYLALARFIVIVKLVPVAN
jgi:hypothetical protein